MQELITDIAVLKKEMENITEQVKKGFSDNSDEHKELIALFTEAMEKKAGKWVENVLIGVGSVIGTGILVAALALIFK